MQKVNRLLAAPVLDARDFALFKADTITYLNDFIEDLDILAVRIRQRLEDLDQIDPAAVRAALAAGEAVSGQIIVDGDADELTWARQAQMHRPASQNHDQLKLRLGAATVLGTP